MKKQRYGPDSEDGRHFKWYSIWKRIVCTVCLVWIKPILGFD
jgi:hypothetical protein